MQNPPKNVPVGNETGAAPRPTVTPAAPTTPAATTSGATTPSTASPSTTTPSTTSDEASRAARDLASSAESAATRASNIASSAAADAADSAREAADSAAARARATARDTAGSVVERVDEVADEAISSVRSRVDQVADEGKSRTREYISTFGRALEAASGSLESDGMSGTAGYVRAAANGLHDAANEVEGFETHALTSRVEDYVRERPMLTMGALALVGFAVASAMSSRNRRI